MISDVLSLLEFFNKMKSEASIKVAHFDGKGQKISGDTDIILKVHQVQNSPIFYFEVNPISEYTFLRYPVNPGGVVEDFASISGSVLSTHFRYVPTSIVSTGGQNNVIVPFIIYGYKTKALTEIGSPVGP